MSAPSARLARFFASTHGRTVGVNVGRFFFGSHSPVRNHVACDQSEMSARRRAEMS